jgi:hypothetical protein
MNIEQVDITHAKPLNQAAFCHYPKNDFYHLPETLADFKKAEERKSENSKLYVEFAKTERHEKNRQFYESVWGAPSNEVREQSEKTNRLVITRKSPTSDLSLNGRETSLRIYHRAWSGEYRVSVESFTRLQEPPPAQAGERSTAGLTERAASKIKDSGAFVAACKGGFNTFGTLTMDEDTRRRVLVDVCHPVKRVGRAGYIDGVLVDGPANEIEWKPETTIGKEVSRFMDNLQKKYSRGWTWRPSKKELLENPMLEMMTAKHRPVYVGVKHSKYGPKPVAKKINYIWVAENPPKIVDKPFLNKAGENGTCKINDNPHVHFLMDWKVEKHEFKGWAEQLESAWGNGFNHLERVRSPQRATGYLLKALGYMTKGSHVVDKETGEVLNSQGIIKGNRYGISKDARAPEWECISEYEAAHMGQVIREVGERIQIRSSEIKQSIKAGEKQQNKLKASIAKLGLASYRAKVPEKLVKERLTRANETLRSCIGKLSGLRDMPFKMDYSNKFKITFREKHRLDSFIQYSVIKHGWKAKIKSYVKTCTLETKAISDWAKKCLEDSEIYWQSLMCDIDNNQAVGE